MFVPLTLARLQLMIVDRIRSLYVAAHVGAAEEEKSRASPVEAGWRFE